MATMSARLPDWLAAEIRRFWEEHGDGPSVGLRKVAEEWWALQRWPLLSFRDGVAGRRAIIRDGPDVWEVASTARAYAGDLDRLYEHTGGHIPREALEQALEYAAHFRDEIDSWIRENERIGRLLGMPE